jgi:hypothetical protein
LSILSSSWTDFKRSFLVIFLMCGYLYYAKRKNFQGEVGLIMKIIVLENRWWVKKSTHCIKRCEIGAYSRNHFVLTKRKRFIWTASTCFWMSAWHFCASFQRNSRLLFWMFTSWIMNIEHDKRHRKHLAFSLLVSQSSDRLSFLLDHCCGSCCFVSSNTLLPSIFKPRSSALYTFSVLMVSFQ